MPTKKVTTATLIRGSLYSFRHPDNTPQNPVEALRFERGVPVPITDQRIINILESLTDETRDGDGEYFDKPIFRIDHNVPMPDHEHNYGSHRQVVGTQKQPRKLAADRPVRTRRKKVT